MLGMHFEMRRDDTHGWKVIVEIEGLMTKFLKWDS